MKKPLLPKLDSWRRRSIRTFLAHIEKRTRHHRCHRPIKPRHRIRGHALVRPDVDHLILRHLDEAARRVPIVGAR